MAKNAGQKERAADQPSGTSYRLHTTGRAVAARELAALLGQRDGPSVLLLCGESGAGRSTVLREVESEWGAAPVPVYRIRCRPGDQVLPFLLAYRLIAGLSRASAPAVPGSGGSAAPWEPVRAFAPVAEDAVLTATAPKGVSAPVTAALAGVVRGSAPAVVLVDDAQHCDPETAELLGQVTEGSATAVRLVLAVRTRPGGEGCQALAEPSAAAALARLAGAGATHVMDLPPLDPDDIARLITVLLRAVPDTGVADTLHRLSRGVPGAVVAAIWGYRAAGHLRLVGGYACLIDRAGPPVLPDDDRFVQGLRALGEPCWEVAKAMSVLAPLGSLAPRLAAEALGLSIETVRGAVERLVWAGVLEASGDAEVARCWAFRIPLVAVATQARLLPYQLRRFSAVAVEALWAAAGESDGSCVPAVERAYLLDRVADAGSLIDRGRAAGELLGAAAEMRITHIKQVSRWLGVAADLVDDPAIRAMALAGHAGTAFQMGDFAGAMDAAEAVTNAYARILDPGLLQETSLARVSAMAATGETTRLRRLVDRDWRDTPGPDGMHAVVRQLALCLHGRFAEVRGLLERIKPSQEPGPVERFFIGLFETAADYVLGEPLPFRESLRDPPSDALPPQLLLEQVVHQTLFLLGMNELREARDRLRLCDLAVEQMAPQQRVLEGYLDGTWDESLALSRWVVTNSTPTDRMPATLLVHSRASTMLLARGLPARAYQFVDLAKSVSPPMPHLLAAEEAAIHRALGQDELAEKALRQGLDHAMLNGYVMCTGEPWAALADLEAANGRLESAAACLAEVERVANSMENESNRLLFLLTSARLAGAGVAVGPDAADIEVLVGEAVDLARRRGQPFESACTFLTAGALGFQPRTLLPEAYATFGELGAILWRFRTRAAMRAANVTVPARRETTTENEQLLAVLIAEDLTNRQLAAMLDLSEDAVANRITRLFSHTGLRSRVEVATAVLTGAYP